MPRLALLGGLLALCAIAHSATFAIGPIKLNRLPRLAEMSSDEGSRFIEAEIRRSISDRLLQLGYQPTEATADLTLQFEVVKVSQRNRTPEEIIQAPRLGASETKVEVVLTVTTGGKSTTSGTLAGFVKGGLFGTTNRRDMSGAPSDKAQFIRVVNSQRAKAIAAAVWNALETSIPKPTASQ